MTTKTSFRDCPRCYAEKRVVPFSACPECHGSGKVEEIPLCANCGWNKKAHIIAEVSSQMSVGIEKILVCPNSVWRTS